MSKYTYAVEVMYIGKWRPIVPDAARGYCMGYLDARRDGWTPRLAMRVTRSDGKVIEDLQAVDEVSIGMVAGSATAEQYEDAASRALDRAEAIRAMDRQRLARRAVS